MSRSTDRRPPVGVLLREWRAARKMSQLDLALECGLSGRHLGFIETGKANPSRDVVMRLADALGAPLRERNALLLAAGYAPHYPHSDLQAPSLERMREAIDLILQHQEPFPAFVITRRFDVLMANPAAVRVNAFLMQGRSSRHENLLHQIFDPEDFRAVIDNWADVALKFLRQLHEERVANPADEATRKLLDDLMAYPDVPAAWARREMGATPAPVLTMTFKSPAGPLRFFETITTFAAPQDVTLDDLRIDCAFPADAHTAAICRQLAISGGS